jgi:hypothetical protein
MACDLAYMFPLVELARQHVYFTPDIAYIYNRATGINDDKKSRSKQVFFEQYIRAAPRYEPLIEHPASKPSIGVVKNTDVLIFGSNRPVELFATLESLEPYRDRIGEIFVFYSANYSKMNVAYQRLKADFSHVHFICQNKNELLTILTDPRSDHVLIVSEGTVFKRDCDFKEAVEDLERSQLSSYSFYLDKTLLSDYEEIISLKGLREGLYGVVFSSEGRVDFEKSSRSYGALYRKNTIKNWLEDSASFTDFLEKWPLHHQGKNSIVICKERPTAFHVSQLTQACEEFSTKEGLGCMADKCSGKSSKVLPQIFVNESESIICIDEASSRLQKDEVTDCVEFSSVCEKCRLDEYIDVISKGAI